MSSRKLLRWIFVAVLCVGVFLIYQYINRRILSEKLCHEFTEYLDETLQRRCPELSEEERRRVIEYEVRSEGFANFYSGRPSMFHISRGTEYAIEFDVGHGTARERIRQLAQRAIDLSSENRKPAMQEPAVLAGLLEEVAGGQPSRSRLELAANITDASVWNFRRWLHGDGDHQAASAKQHPATVSNLQDIRQIITDRTEPSTFEEFNLRDDLLKIAAGMYQSYGKGPLIGVRGKQFDETGLSWRVHMLPFLGETELHGEFRLDEPWDSDHNMRLLKRMPSVFSGTSLEAGFSTLHLPICEGSVNARENARLNDVRDGTSNTICVVVGVPETAKEWTRPGFLDIDISSPETKLSAHGLAKILGGHPVVTFAGQTKLVNATLSNQQFSLLLKSDDGSRITPDYHLHRWPSVFFTGSGFSWNAAFRSGRRREVLTRNDPAFVLRLVAGALRKLPADQLAELSSGESDTNSLSWRVHILPHIGHKDLYAQFRLDEPWDSPANRALVDSMPPIYQRAGAAYRVVANSGDTETGVAVVMTRHGGAWTKHNPLPVSRETPRNTFTVLDGGFPVAMKDGAVHLLNPDIPDKLLMGLLTGEKRTDDVSEYIFDWAN